MRGPPGDRHLKLPPALARRHALTAVARWSITRTYFDFNAAASIAVRLVGLPTSSSGTYRRRTGQSHRTPVPHKVLQCVIGHIGLGLHAIDTGPEHLVGKYA